MSELALRLIEENKKNRATFLDLGNCDLTSVPNELGELVWLEELSFSNLPQIKGLVKETRNTGSSNRIRYLKGRTRTSNSFLHLGMSMK